MASIKKGDFVEVEYTGMVKENDFVFDTTSEKVAKDNHIHDQHAQYGPLVICVGQHQLLKGLDESLAGKEIGKEYTLDITPEQGFGKKSAQLLKLVPLSAFKKGQVMPEPGMQVEVDNQLGIVKTVTGGRVVVDFNHPLASKDLKYTVKVNRIVTDDTEKVRSLISLTLNLRKDLIKVNIADGKANVTMLKLPEEFQKEFAKKIKELIPTLEEVVFIEEKQEKNTKQPLNRSEQ